LPTQQNHEWFVSCEDLPKLNWVVGSSGLSMHFLVVIPIQMGLWTLKVGIVLNAWWLSMWGWHIHWKCAPLTHPI
jgi:hypothetical protein